MAPSSAKGLRTGLGIRGIIGPIVLSFIDHLSGSGDALPIGEFFRLGLYSNFPAY
jgi:hypothetical protein